MSCTIKKHEKINARQRTEVIQKKLSPVIIMIKTEH